MSNGLQVSCRITDDAGRSAFIKRMHWYRIWGEERKAAIESVKQQSWWLRWTLWYFAFMIPIMLVPLIGLVVMTMMLGNVYIFAGLLLMPLVCAFAAYVSMEAFRYGPYLQ